MARKEYRRRIYENSNKVALGLVGGALLGTVVGMILPPKTGKQTGRVLLLPGQQVAPAGEAVGRRRC